MTKTIKMFLSIFPFILLVLASCYVSNTKAEEITCNVELHNKKAEIKLKYDRDQLGIYKRNATNSVNVLLSFVNVSFTGNLFPKVGSTIDGVAVLNKETNLCNCNLAVKIYSENNKTLQDSLQNKFIEKAKSCIDYQLCKRFSEITSDDFIRAKLVPYDFGETTVLYLELHKTYRNKEWPDSNTPQEPLLTKNYLLQMGLNSLSDLILTGVISIISGDRSGYITLPDLQNELSDYWVFSGYLNMTNGYLGDLRNIMRTEDVTIKNDGLRYTLQCGVRLIDATIAYKQYNLKYFLLTTSGTGTINIDNVELRLQIIINYNIYPCELKLGYIQTRVDKPKFTLTGAGFTDSIINTVVNPTFEYSTNAILAYLQNLIENTINGSFERLDCEKFRPRSV